MKMCFRVWGVFSVMNPQCEYFYEIQCEKTVYMVMFKTLFLIFLENIGNIDSCIHTLIFIYIHIYLFIYQLYYNEIHRPAAELIRNPLRKCEFRAPEILRN